MVHFRFRCKAPLVALLSMQAATAGLIVQYDPVGPQLSDTSVPTAFVASNVTASSLSQVGFEGWGNSDFWPVGRITSSATIDLSHYLTFEVTGDLRFDSLTYDKMSYLNSGATAASIRSSHDSFGSDIDTITVNPDGAELLTFNLSSMAASALPVEFRIYFYGAPSDFADWDDLVGSNAGGTGLRVFGDSVPEPSTVLMGCAGIALICFLRRRVA